MMQIVPATTPDQIADIRQLFSEYHDALDPSVQYRNFDAELDALPGPYARPDGRLLLAMQEGDAVGCGALKPFGEGISELKRLFVRPQHRRRGAGRSLATAIIAEARSRGIKRLRLDTLPDMREALALYRSLGFTEIPPYFDDPLPGAICMELVLADR